MAEKVTMMVIKVDLQCDRCYKKIRKVLCRFPEIRDQVYDEKQNTVKITVVSCCPDRIKKKIWSKGGESVEKIEIVSGDKKKEPEKKKEGGGGGDKAKDSAAGGEKKKDEPEKKGGKEGEPKKKDGGKEGEPKKKDGGKEGGKGPAKEPEKKKDGGDKPKDKEPEMKAQPKPKQPMPVPVAGYPSIFPPVYPVQAYYDPYQQHPQYQQHQVAGGGPRPCHCQQCHGNMPGYYSARDANRGGYNGCQYDYFSEENPSGCTVM